MVPVGVLSKEHLFHRVSRAEHRVFRGVLWLGHRGVDFPTMAVQAEDKASRDHSAPFAADTTGVNAGVILASVTCVASRDIFLMNVRDARIWAERHLRLQYSFPVLVGPDQVLAEAEAEVEVRLRSQEPVLAEVVLTLDFCPLKEADDDQCSTLEISRIPFDPICCSSKFQRI